MKANLLKRLNVTNVIFSGCAHGKCASDGQYIKVLYRHLQSLEKECALTRIIGLL